MQEHVDNVIRELEILRKRPKWNASKKTKNTVIEIKNAFDGLINTLDVTGNIFEIENISTESSKIKEQREQNTNPK